MQGRSDHLWRRLPVLSVVALLFALVVPAAAGAAVNHAFSATLSLTGGTAVSQRDPVPDPGPNHPPQEFQNVCGIAVDAAGDTYVANFQGRIDIFDPEGHWLQEIANDKGPCALAVDSVGTLYVQQIGASPQSVMRYVPDEYPPTTSTTYEATLAVGENTGDLAVNRANDHLLLISHNRVEEFSSATETPAGDENAFIRSFGETETSNPTGIAVDSATGYVFVSSVCDGCPYIPPTSSEHVSVVKVFDESGSLIETIDGSDLPGGGFGSYQGILHLAVNEETGELFVADVFGGVSNAKPHVYRFVFEGGSYKWVEDKQLETHFYENPATIAVANTEGGPTSGTVYVTSQGAPGHSYAFPPNTTGPPLVSDSAASNPTTDEVELESVVNPNGLPTRFRIEFVDRETAERDVEELGAGHEFDHAGLASSGTLVGTHESFHVSAVLSGLIPGTAYYFRTVAENCAEGEPENAGCATDGETVLFATYPESAIAGACPNEEFRVGFAATLPDCRAYELVTPADTNGRVPTASFIGKALLGSPVTEVFNEDGSGLLFMVVGGSLPIGNGNGVADGYEAVRSSTGWQTRPMGPAGSQTQTPEAGSASPDHQYWFWTTGGATDHGSLVIGGQPTSYLRLPDGTFELVGEGPLGTDPRAIELNVFSNGHMLFSSKTPLIEGASPAGVSTVYDKAPDGALEVVSREPSGEAPGAGADVAYEGTDASGTTVVFSVTEGGVKTLYLRRGGNTVAVTTGATVFAGLSEDGSRLTYVKAGDIFSFDADTLTTQPVGSGGKSTVVNVSPDGSHVYFVSTKVLPGTDGAAPGEQNLYVWNANTNGLAFIAKLDPFDVEGEVFLEGRVFGLGQWTAGTGSTGRSGTDGPAEDPSRTTPDGRAFVFESHANLTGYDSEGHSEIYRYAPYETPQLRCLSCNPTLAAPASDARLQMLEKAERGAVTNGHVPAHNITPDGTKVFFQTGDPLVPEDVDGKTDVYEWQAPGSGACGVPAGCLALISSGHTAGINALYNVSKSGNDVFFATSDQLLPADADPTISIYDARVNGGIAGQAEEDCAGDGCKGQPSATPSLPPAGSTAPSSSGNLNKQKHCKKGQRKVRRNGKVKCVVRHKHHHHKRNHHARGHRSTGGGAR